VATYLLILIPLLLVVGIVYAVKRQAAVTSRVSREEHEQDQKVFAQSAKLMEATVAEELAKKAGIPAWLQ